MSTLDCAGVRGVAPEFAVGVLDGADRAEVVDHLERCPACRTVVAELSEAADSLVLVAPEAEPPPGFEERVMAGLRGGRRRGRWRTAKLVAAVAAAAVITSVATVRVVDRGRVTEAAVPAVATVPMIGDDGAYVGQVDVVDTGTFASLALRVDYSLPDGAYQVVLAPDAAERQVLGTVTVRGGHGAWAGSAPLAGDSPEIELVGARGDVPCSARLPAR